MRPARHGQPYDAPTTEAFRAARNARPEGSPTTEGFRAARHARRRRSSRTRWVVLAAVVVGLAAVTAAVGFIARPSSGSPSNPPSASLAAPLPPAQVSSTGTPTGKATSPSATSPGSPPAGLGSNWKLTFNAGFTGSKLDTSVWGTCYPWQSQSGCANFGNSDLEYQWYMPSQDQVSDGALHIVAQEEPTSGTNSSGDPEEYSYRSGLVTTFPGYKFQYGYLQVVARIPDAQGTWSALWMAAANEQWPPEIDILEHWDVSKDYYEYYHPAGAPRENTVEALGNLSTSYHTYGVYWSQSKIVWYIDGHQVFESVRNVPQQPMYFLANVAVYKQAPSLSTPAALDIKSVSVWQQAG
jgi:beta-glucanase (GH16 family)